MTLHKCFKCGQEFDCLMDCDVPYELPIPENPDPNFCLKHKDNFQSYGRNGYVFGVKISVKRLET